MRLGRINTENNVNYVIVPKGYFNKIKMEKGVEKILKALSLPKPEMIFKVPRNYTMDEYFVHDSDNLILEPWKSFYKKNLEQYIKYIDDNEIEKILSEENVISIEDLKWNKCSLDLAIDCLHKAYLSIEWQESDEDIIEKKIITQDNTENKESVNENHNIRRNIPRINIRNIFNNNRTDSSLSEDISDKDYPALTCSVKPELFKQLTNLRRYRNLVKQRVSSIIRGLTDACRQASAFLWLESHREQDMLGNFVAKNSVPGTIVLTDAILPETFVDDDMLGKFIEDFEPGNKNAPVYVFLKEFCRQTTYNNLIEFSKPFNPDVIQTDFKLLEMKSQDLINDIENKCIKIIKSKPEEWQQKMAKKRNKTVEELNKNKKWLEYKPKEKQHTLHYFECIKPGITHLIYWHDEKDFLLWKTFLSEQYPLGLFLIGGLNAAYEQAMQCLKENQPLFVFDKTGGTASIVAEMINTMKKVRPPFGKIKKKLLQQFPSKKSNFLKAEKAHLENAIIFQEIQAKAKVTLQNWPDPFNPNSVLIVNTLTDSIEALQDNITKTMNAVFEDVPQLGSKKEDTKRLLYAWKKQKLLSNNAKNLKNRADTYLIILSILTFLTTFITVLTGIQVQANYTLKILSVILPI